MAEAKTKFYEVKVGNGYPMGKESYNRAGVTLTRKGANVVELTDEQAKEMKDDRYIASIKSTKAPKREAGVGKPTDKVSNQPPVRDPKAVAKAKKLAQKDDSKTKKPEETSASPVDDEVAKLLSENSYDELAAIAEKAGMENATSAKNKTVLAKFIIKNKAPADADKEE